MVDFIHPSHGHNSDDIQVFESGRRPALIEQFGIEGLYGYRNISLSSSHAATILIARNGTGKTTLIGALHAFLQMQLFRLKNLEFELIYCKIRSVPHVFSITKNDIDEFTAIDRDDILRSQSVKIDTDINSLFEFITSSYEDALRYSYVNAETGGVAAKVLRANDFNLNRAIKVCAEMQSAIFSRVPRLQELRQSLIDALSEFEIVYLPTYRRIELALTDEHDTRGVRTLRKRRPRISVSSGGLFTGDIQFGLSDVSERLRELNDKIIRDSNSNYRKISENIITDLINGYDQHEVTNIPKEQDLKLFFSRLESSIRSSRSFHPLTPPDFARVYSGEGIPPESLKFLRYFLTKLNEIVQVTKEVERPIEEFILRCNNYLALHEGSTILSDERSKTSATMDTKILRMNRKDLSVYVERYPEGTKIELDHLSSGEKQMISLLAKLYLYPKRRRLSP